MAHVEVSPDAVAGIGSQIAAAGSIPTTPAVTVSPPAHDPVSVGVAQTSPHGSAPSPNTAPRPARSPTSARTWPPPAPAATSSRSRTTRPLWPAAVIHPPRRPRTCRYPPFRRCHRRVSRRPRLVPHRRAAGPSRSSVTPAPVPRHCSPPPSRCASTPPSCRPPPASCANPPTTLARNGIRPPGRRRHRGSTSWAPGMTATPSTPPRRPPP